VLLVDVRGRGVICGRRQVALADQTGDAGAQHADVRADARGHVLEAVRVEAEKGRVADRIAVLDRDLIDERLVPGSQAP
jgi:putative NADH-flavin reductase